MKNSIKVLLFIAAWVISSVQAFADNQTRLTGQWTMQGEESNMFRAAAKGRALHLGGLGVEYVTEHFGFGGSTMFYFGEYSSGFWNMKLDTQIFVSYHILDNQQVFDPFILVGAGGKMDMDVKSGHSISVVQYSSPDHGGYYSNRRTRITRKGASFYPFIGAGAGLNFKNGLYLSARITWKPVFTKAPLTNYPRADELPYELLVSVGYSFNRTPDKKSE